MSEDRCSRIPKSLLNNCCMAFLALVLALGFCSLSSLGAELHITVADEQENLLPCRILVRVDDSQCYTPAGAVVLEIGRDRWFMANGNAQLDLPEGEIELRIERGLEFIRYKELFSMDVKSVVKRIALKRWINMKEQGYLCVENHLHQASDVVGPMAIAEGLDFGGSLTWWNGPDARRPVPEGKGRTRVLKFADREVVASVHDAELEYGWGAAYIQNLPEPLPIPANPKRPNMDYLEYAIENGAIVHYQAGWSREVGLNALLGQVHTVNVCNNNFHLHRFQPRQRYSNLLKVEGFPVYPNTDRDMMRMNTETYYRLLNWGLKLAAGAGSACGVKQVPVGYNRAYVRVLENASLEQLNEAWKQGRNFVTNGPILVFRSDDGKGPGDEIRFGPGGGTVNLTLDVRSDQALQSVEIVQNGTVVKTFKIISPNKSEYSVSLNMSRSCWLVARCTARDDLLTDEELRRYRNPPGQLPSRLRFAHTSPIYVSVNGRPAINRESVREGLQMLDKLEAYARENAASEYLQAFLTRLDEGRSLLNSRLN